MKKFFNKSIAFIAILVAFFVVSACGKKEIKKYTVTFKSGGEEISSVIVEKGKLVEEPDNPVKEDYDFSGWYADTEYKTEFDFENTKIVKNTIIYAKFVEKQQIIFKTNGGSDVTSILCFSNQVEATEKNQFNCSQISAVPLTNKEGHTFEGWYLDSSFENKVVFPFKVNNRTTMYAKWTATGHQVNYVTNSTEVIAPVTKDYDTELEEIVLDPKSKKGAASFEGWYLDAAFTEKVTFPYKVKKSITLYAKWKMREVNVYFIDTTIESGNNKIDDLSEIKYYGSSIELQEITYSKTNYIFKGWYLDAELTQKAPDLFSLEPELESSILNVYLYAKLELNNNTVSLDPNGGNFDGSTSIKTFTPIEGEVSLAEQINSQVPLRLGYRFLEYKVKGGDYITKITEFNERTSLTSTYELIADWEAVDYKIKLYINSNGTGTLLEKEYSKEDIINLSSYLDDNSKTKEGYDFKGVCTIATENINNECETIYKESQFIIDENANKYASDVFDKAQGKYYRVIYLKIAFTPKLVSVVVDADGGSFDYNSKLNLSNVEYGTLISDLKVSAPTKEGYNWTGWKICDSNNSCRTISLEAQKTTKIESEGLTLTAIWEIKKHTISVTGIGRELPLSMIDNIEYGTNVIISYLNKWDNQSCTNSLCIFYLGTSYNGNDLIIANKTTTVGMNIGQYNTQHFIGFYNEMDTYISSFTINDNTLLYAKYDASKEITYSLNEDEKNYSATSFSYNSNSNIEVTIASIFMGKEVTTITKECFSDVAALKISSLIIPETIKTIEKNSFIYLLKLQKLTIPVDFNEFSFSNIFGVNDEHIISHLRYLKIIGAGLTKFVIDNLEGLSYLKELQELYLPYSVEEFNEDTISALESLRYLTTFNIEEKESSNQKYLSKKENNYFIIYDKVTNVEKHRISCKNNDVPYIANERYSISFICVNGISYNCSNFDEYQIDIGTELNDFNKTKVPVVNGYTFMGWWYHTTDEKGNIEYTEPYMYENLRVMFAESVELCAKFVKGNWVFDNDTLVSIGDLVESDESIEIEKYYLGKEIKEVDLSSMDTELNYVLSLTLSSGLTSINLAGKFPALYTIKMVGNMDCSIGNDKCNVANVLKNATGGKLDNEYSIEILHSDDKTLNQITDETFKGLEDVPISNLRLPTSLVFDLVTYPIMFKELNKVSTYSTQTINDEKNVIVSLGFLYGKVKIDDDYEWALLRSSTINLTSSITTGTLIDGEPIKQIAPYAFYKISGIEKVKMIDDTANSNSQIHTIGEYAFANMENLKFVTLGMSIRNIAETAFYESYNIEEYNIDKLNGVYSVMDGVLFKNYETILVKYPSNKEDDTYLIPSSVEEIERYAFDLNSNKSLHLIISENVSKISGYDFSELHYHLSYELGNFYNISSFEVVKENPYFESVNGILYDKNLEFLIHFGKETESTQVFLEDSIKNIIEDAFKYNVGDNTNVREGIISTILITNDDPSKNISYFLNKLEEVLHRNQFLNTFVKVYYSAFEGQESVNNEKCYYTRINTNNTYSFRIYTSGDLTINGEKQELNTDNGYFIYNSLILETAPSTTSSSVFKGWYLDSYYETEAKFPLLSINESGEAVSLYAKFGTTYTVNFESKGGTIFASREYVDEITENDLPTPEKIGYTFGGWYLDSSYEEKVFENGNTCELKLPITTLYAKWEVIMTIKTARGYNDFGYVFNEDTKPIDVGTTISAEIANYENYNWYANKECTEKFSENKSINGSITIYGMPLIKIEVWQYIDNKKYIETYEVEAFTKLEDIEDIKNMYDELSKEYATLTIETGEEDKEENLYKEISIEDRIISSLNITECGDYPKIIVYKLIIYLDDAYSSVKVVIVNEKNSSGEYQFNEKEEEIKFSNSSTKFTEVIKDYSNYNWYTDNLCTEKVTGEYINQYKNMTLFAIPLVEITVSKISDDETYKNVIVEAFAKLEDIKEIKDLCTELDDKYVVTILVEDKECQLTDMITSTLNVEYGKYSAKSTFNITINCENVM